MNRVEEIWNNPDDYSLVVYAYEFYLKECERLQKIINTENVRGSRLRDWAMLLPSLTDEIQSKWAELKAIAGHLDILITVTTQKARKHYIESYNRQLTSYQIKDYAEAEPNVIELRQLLLRITLVIDKWEGLSKGVERLGFQVRNLIELRKNGLDEISI